MATGSNFGAAKILCVESDVAVLKAGVQFLNFRATMLLRQHPGSLRSCYAAKNLIWSLSQDWGILTCTESYNLSDGAGVLVLDANILPSEMLFLVAQRLNDSQRRA
jgi:hypothetical protein